MMPAVSYNVLSRSGLPLFSIFFIWATGTGSMHLARPLFAASFGASVFLVSLLLASNSLARMVASPITGFLSDRFGRRPLVIIGIVLRGSSAVLAYFSTSYEQFLILEFFGGIGISIFSTGASIILADVSSEHQRGRAVALRGMSLRLGLVSGPFIGAVIAGLFDLRTILLFNGVTKLLVLGMFLALIRETRPEAPIGRQRARARLSAEDRRVLLSPSYLAVAAATLAIGMMELAGAAGGLFALMAQSELRLNTPAVGNLLTLAGIVAVATAFPNGMLVDRFGRKPALIAGLLVFAACTVVLSGKPELGVLVLAMVVFGVADGMCQGSAQVFAMDLAPPDRRGAYLGIWQIFGNLGGLISPLLVGAIAQVWGFGPAFLTMMGLLLLAAFLVAVYARETRRAAPAAA